MMNGLTTLCYLEKNNSYLMLNRDMKPNDPNHGKWIGIGGGFENNESPDDCLKREVYEETGLSLNSYLFRGIVTFVSDTWETEYMHLFTSSDFQGDLIECNEGHLKWVAKKDIFNLNLWEGDRIFLKLLDSNEPFFSLKLEYKGDSLLRAYLNGKNIFISGAQYE